MTALESLASSRNACNGAGETPEARREHAILEHMTQVLLIARQFHRKLAGNVSLDDLVSTGTLGLIAAIDSFCESYGVKLCTYAEHKIRGAVLDSLRELDWVPRGRRRRAKEMETAIRSLEQRLHRSPTVEEAAAESCLSINEFHARMSEAHALNLTSLDAPARRDGKLTVGALIPDTIDNQPSAKLESLERHLWLRKAIDTMPQINRTVLALWHYDGLTRREVATVMGISPTQVTRLKEDSLQRLRVRMEPLSRRYIPHAQHSTMLFRIA